MLKSLQVKKFKSLEDVKVNLPSLSVLFGPNAAGKSNFFDVVQALSRLATSRTLADALSEPIRGYAIEAFSFPPGGLGALYSMETAAFSLEAELDVGKDHSCYRYKITVHIHPGSGGLSIIDEYLTALGRRGEPSGGEGAADYCDHALSSPL